MLPDTGIESADLLQLHWLHPTNTFTGQGTSASLLAAPAGETVGGAGAAAPAAPGGITGVCVPGATCQLAVSALAQLGR